RYPSANQMVLRPGNPNRLLVRTTFGLLLSNDAGKTWDWVCEGAFGYQGAGDLGVTYTGGGSVLVAPPKGLVVSVNRGGALGLAGGAAEGRSLVDVTVRPDKPAAAVALASALSTATGSHDSQVFTTEDDGATWAPLGAPLDPAAELATIEVARSDPGRIYASG